MNIKTKMAYLLIKVECLCGEGLSHCSQWSEEGLMHNRHLVYFYRSGGSEFINNKIENITRCLKDRERQGRRKKEEQMTKLVFESSLPFHIGSSEIICNLLA